MGKMLYVLIYVLLVLGVNSLIMWGLGNLIIYVFKINYTWTFLHGFVTILIFNLLKGIFNRG